MSKSDNICFKSMCVFNYEHNNNILTTIVYFKSPNYNIIKFHNTCILIAKINNCLNLNIISNNEMVNIKLNEVTNSLDIYIDLAQQLQYAINKQLTNITL